MTVRRFEDGSIEARPELPPLTHVEVEVRAVIDGTPFTYTNHYGTKERRWAPGVVENMLVAGMSNVLERVRKEWSA